MHLQENALYDLDLVVKVTQNVVQCPPNHMTYAPVNFEAAMSNGSGEDPFKKIHYLTLGYLTLTPRSRSHEVLPSTLNIM